jgi:hypothetical protein
VELAFISGKQFTLILQRPHLNSSETPPVVNQVNLIAHYTERTETIVSLLEGIRKIYHRILVLFR